MPCAAVVEACQTWPKFTLGLLESLNARLSQLYLSSSRMGRLPLEVQLDYLLWGLARASPEGCYDDRKLPYRVPQQLMRDYFGVPREQINRKMKTLEREGYWAKLDAGMTLRKGLVTLFTSNGPELAGEQFVAVAGVRAQSNHG